MMNNEMNAFEKSVEAIIEIYCASNESEKDQKLSVRPRMASNPSTETGTIIFLRLKISATKQKIPKDAIAINTCIIYDLFITAKILSIAGFTNSLIGFG